MSLIGPRGNNIWYDPDKNCSNNSAITLTLKTWLKITAHPLSKGTLQVKYEPDWAKERKDMHQTSDLGWTDGRTDGRMGSNYQLKST